MAIPDGDIFAPGDLAPLLSANLYARIIHVGRNKVAQLVCRNRANASGGVTHLVHALCGEKRTKFRHRMRLRVPAYKLVNISGYDPEGMRPRMIALFYRHKRTMRMTLGTRFSGFGKYPWAIFTTD
jgi:hypothetical protein